MDWNPDLIYEYVHNNVQTIPVYDSLKGPLGTLIDGAGTPIDQAELMYVLLQQSCYSPQYESGTIFVSGTQMANWLGADLSTTYQSLGAILENNGFPGPIQAYASSGTIVGVDVPWVWVSVPIPSGGQVYQFDPAGKIFEQMNDYGYNTRSTGISNLGSAALGYHQTAFLNDAESGAHGIGTYEIYGLNRANVRQDLAEYANNLVSHIQGTVPTATTSVIIGGASIATLPPYTPPTSGPTLWGQKVLCNYGSGASCQSYGPYGTPPTNLADLSSYRTTLKLTLGYGSGSTFTALASAVTFFSSDIYGHRLSVQFDSSTSVPSLLLDGVSQVTASGPVPSGNQLTIRLAINHPHIMCASLPIPSGCPGGPGPAIDNVRVTPAPGAVFVIGTAWGGTERGMIEKHRKLLRQNTALNPGNPNAEAVLGEGLAMIGYSWLAESTRIQERVTEIAGVTTTYLHAVGIIGMKAVGSSQGPYVDLPINTLNTIQRVDNSGSANPTPAETSAFTVDANMASVLESGSLEQTQTGATAVSTVKLLDLWSQSPTAEIYDINDAAITGDDCAFYGSTIRPLMTPSYGNTGPDILRIDALVGYTYSTNTCSASTTRVIALSSDQITVSSSSGSWTGTGYQQILYDPTQSIVTGIGNIITGGLSGGEPASVVSSAEINTNQTGEQVGSQYVPATQSAASTVSSASTNITSAEGGSSGGQKSGGDPVDLVTGSYTYTHQDISVGSGVFPDTLPFTRYFDSVLAQSGRNSSLLGNGWMHSYDMTALPNSDGFEGMGDNSPISGAATIAALYVMNDILNLSPSTAKPTERIWIAAQAQLWLMEQLTNNIVSVAKPGAIENFTQLANGTYNPPLGLAAVLTGNPSAGYTYQGPDGATLSFYPTSAVASGRVTNWSSAAGAEVGFYYNSLGQLQSVCEPSCAAPRRQLNFTYTSNQLISVNDGTGTPPRTVGFAYDSSDDLTGVTDPQGYQTRFAYGAPGQLTNIYYPANPAPFFSQAYDTLGRPDQQFDANGHMTTLKIAGTRAETDDPGGTARVSYFTSHGRTLATIDGLGSPDINGGAGNLTSYTYDGLDRVLTVTLPELGYRVYTYDAYSNPLSIVLHPKPGSGLGNLTQSFTYISPVGAIPNFEEIQTATDPRGLVTTFGYDLYGNRILSIADSGGTSPFNARSSFTYDASGRVLTTTDPLGRVRQLNYDNLGDLISIIRDYGGLNQTISFGYDAAGNVVSTTDPKGNVTTGNYDADRRLTETITPAGAGGSLTTSQTYDPNGNLLQTQRSSGGQVLQALGSTYTLTGKVATATDANGNVTRYGYDAVDRLSSLTDSLGNVTSITYDSLGRKIAVSDPAIQLNPLTQWTYNPDGTVESITIARNNSVSDETSYAYDGFDRLSTTTWPDSSTEVLTYDADSNILTRETRRGDTIAFAYDTLNRVCTKTYATTPVACGGSSSNYLASYAYDLDGRLIAANDNSAALVAPATAASYTTTYAYDALNRPLGASWNPAPAQATPTASSASFAFTYDGTNRRIGQTASDKSWWNYPAVASNVGYTANSLNQYSTVGAVSPTYDGNGNLTYDGTFTYCYDDESRLTSILSAGTCASPTTTVATYAYDAQGRRKAKTVGSATTIYVTDADNREVLEYNGASGSGALQRWYSFGLGADDVLNQMNVAAGTRETMIPDIQGSIVATLDSGGGALTKTGYQPYGENPSLTSGTYQYTARRFDPETAGSTAEPSGLYYYRARHYSPTLGRFLQPDPLGYTAGNNLYAYVGNDPLNRTDPSGNIALIDNLIGAGVGVGVDLFAQYVQARVAGQPFQVDWTRTAVAAGAGFVTSGASALLGEGVSSLGLGAASSFALRTAGNAAIGAAGNVGSTAALNGLEGNNDSLTTAAIAGGGFGALGSVAGDVVTGIGPASAQAQYNALSAGEKNLVNGVADLSGVDLFAPTPAFVTGGVIAGSAVSGGTSFIGGSGTSNTGK